MRAVVACLALVTAGCGYIGDPLPPALRRPVGVTDLAAVQHGSNIIITFTIPKTTTEDLPLKGNEDVELRVGPAGTQSAVWQHASERARVTVTGASAHAEVPAARWYGMSVDIAVNVHGPTGNSVGWSFPVTLDIVPALPKPEVLTATDAPDAVSLAWHAGAPEFRVFRKLAEDTSWAQIATSRKPSYTDNTIEYGKSYEYMVQAIDKAGTGYAESETSDPKSFKPTDKFAPAVPEGLSAVPGSRSIELVWERSTEKDFASYRVFRGGQQIAEGVTAPSYSDRDVKPGTRYEYRVSALDNAGNESAKSAAVEAVIR
jgi:hypothetical protein